MKTTPETIDDFSWLGREAPRYTSYPSAHHFAALPEGAHESWLSTIIPATTISTYIHVPFCKEMCWFCGCHTKVTKRYDPVARYVGLLLQEIELLRAKISGNGRLVNIHFGGGSPSLLEKSDMRAILNAVKSCFGSTDITEQAIELDPRTTTIDKIEMYAALGFNRVSIGIQDFNPEVQQAINRVQPHAMVQDVMYGLRANGFKHINCDLIYGLPLQTPELFRATLEKTIALAPDRIALFSYAHVPQVKKHQRMIETSWLPSEPEKLKLYDMACHMFAANGYTAIGIDHFARSEDSLAIAMNNKSMKRNFQGYVTDTTEVLIGIGNSAISQFPQGYVQNHANSLEYKNAVEAAILPSVRGIGFRGDDVIRKQVIDELMCFMSVDLAAIRRQHSLPDGYFAAELAEIGSSKYSSIAQVTGENIIITTQYRMAARVISAAFDQYRGVAAGRYSKVA